MATVSTITARNRHIKVVLEQAFGLGKVKVHRGMGTAYGWVYVHIAYAPLDSEQAGQLKSQIIALLRAANIALGHYYDDMDNEPHPEISIQFDSCRYSETYVSSEGVRLGYLPATQEWELIEPVTAGGES